MQTWNLIVRPTCQFYISFIHRAYKIFSPLWDCVFVKCIELDNQKVFYMTVVWDFMKPFHEKSFLAVQLTLPLVLLFLWYVHPNKVKIFAHKLNKLISKQAGMKGIWTSLGPWLSLERGARRTTRPSGIKQLLHSL